MSEPAKTAQSEVPDTQNKRPVAWLWWLDKLIFFLPSFSSRSILFRLGVTAFLVGLLIALPMVKFNQTIPLITAALRYNPLEHAQRIYTEGKKVAALNFINFYLSIPGIDDTEAIPGEGNIAELKALKTRIETERGEWGYIAKELWKGVIGDNSEEAYGKALELVTEVTVIGDGRALYSEGSKALRGEEVDALNASLAAAGLGITLVSMGPQGAALTPLRSFTSFMKKCANVMSPTLKKGIVKAYEPVVAFVRKANIKLDSRGIRVMKESGQKMAGLIMKGSESFSDFIKLAARNPRDAILIARFSDDVPALARNSKLVAGMGDEAGKILAHGGKASLKAAEALEKGGRLSGNALKKSMQFGEAGLEWIRKLPLDDLLSKLRAIRITLSGKIWYYLQWLISLIPLPVALLIMTGAGLNLYKMWRKKPTRA